jgi:3-hydroxyisobutyrate dehydrogenase
MKTSPQNTTIGFIGIGVMGKSMALHLLDAGYKLHVHNRTKSKSHDLIAGGAVWEPSVKSLASQCNCIITMVGFPPDVEEVYLGPSGIVHNAERESVCIDMTTSKPQLAVKISHLARSGGVHALDAPVSGGDVGARNAALSIMVGGDEKVFNRVRPVFELMGKNIVYQGGPGSGQYAKMCNQIAIASTMMGMCESLAYAEKSGLAPETVLQSIGSGAAGSWSLANLAPRIIKGDFAPGFFVKHFIKDMAIAIESAQEMGLDLPGLKLAKSLYDRLADQGGENLGTQGLYKVYGD